MARTIFVIIGNPRNLWPQLATLATVMDVRSKSLRQARDPRIVPRNMGGRQRYLSIGASKTPR
jgi:hypothetical protein